MAQYLTESQLFPSGRRRTKDPRYFYLAGVYCSGPLDRGFLVPILPWVERKTEFDAINHALSIYSEEQKTAHAISIGIYACPSDPEAGGIKQGYLKNRFPNFSLVNNSSSPVVGSSYAACQGSLYTTAFEDPKNNCQIHPDLIRRSNGCITDYALVSLASVTDGTSQTMMVAEKASTVLSGIRSNATERVSDYFGLWFAGDMYDSVFTAERGPNQFKQPYSGSQSESGWTASSMHPGGLNILMADGSVRFVKETIDSGTNNGKTGLWQKLATRNGGEVIDSGSY